MSYLDALFAPIRAFAEEMDASRRWLARAEQTENQAWRLSFLREARAAYERAAGRLAVVTARVAELGALPPPLDRVAENVASMRAALSAQEERLNQRVAREAEGAPIGRG